MAAAAPHRPRALSTELAVAPGRPPSAAAATHARLREEIVALHRKPGEALSEKLISEQNGVSRTPVREAILRLAGEGLVDIFPQSGTFVSLIPQAALPEASPSASDASSDSSGPLRFVAIAIVMLAVAGWVTFRIRRHHAGAAGSGSGVDKARANTENGTDK